MSAESCFKPDDVVQDTQEHRDQADDPDIGVVTRIEWVPPGQHDGREGYWLVYAFWRQRGAWSRSGMMTARASELEMHPDPEAIWPEFVAWRLSQ